jgi:hypothetical protein
MEVRETLFTKSFSVENNDPYALSIEFMSRLSEIGRIYERKNIYETDGPVKKSVVAFDLVEVLDRFSFVIINFSLESEKNMLYVDILGEFVLRIKEYGFFTEIFTDFYLHNVFPVLRKVSEKRAIELEQHLERL